MPSIRSFHEAARRIAELTGVRAPRLQITISGDAVRLAGSVASLTEKRAVEDAARAALGDLPIRNDLDVAVRSLERGADDDLASMAFLSLRWDAGVPDAVKAHVRDGRVTLTGVVTRQQQRAAAEAAVARLRGVRDLDNRIVIQTAANVAVDL